MLEAREAQELVIQGVHMSDDPINGNALLNVDNQVVGCSYNNTAPGQRLRVPKSL